MSSAMRQKDIRPAPARIEFKGMKFLITDRPSDSNIQNYILVSKFFNPSYLYLRVLLSGSLTILKVAKIEWQYNHNGYRPVASQNVQGAGGRWSKPLKKE